LRVSRFFNYDLLLIAARVRAATTRRFHRAASSFCCVSLLDGFFMDLKSFLVVVGGGRNLRMGIEIPSLKFLHPFY
jgi:hypothetical protein